MAAKKLLQGTWVNDQEGDIVFSFKGDTVFYDDSTSSAVAFHVYHDTLYIENHTMTAYLIKTLNSTQLHFINTEGDDVELTKSNKDLTLQRGEHKGNGHINMGKKIKRDTVITFRDKRYHAYTQVNPTTYKVYRQTTNDDGLSVQSVYYDNIIYIALYEGQAKVFGSNITKAEFDKYVPKAYLDKAVLSDITVNSVSDKGVRFVAILAIPESYTTYRVNIDIDAQGRKTLSV